MSRKVNCIKLEKEGDGLATLPYPGDLGKRIYEQVCQEAWQMWLSHQTMLINEYRLTPIEFCRYRCEFYIAFVRTNTQFHI